MSEQDVEPIINPAGPSARINADGLPVETHHEDDLLNGHPEGFVEPSKGTIPIDTSNSNNITGLEAQTAETETKPDTQPESNPEKTGFARGVFRGFQQLKKGILKRAA